MRDKSHSTSRAPFTFPFWFGCCCCFFFIFAVTQHSVQTFAFLGEYQSNCWSTQTHTHTQECMLPAIRPLSGSFALSACNSFRLYSRLMMIMISFYLCVHFILLVGICRFVFFCLHTNRKQYHIFRDGPIFCKICVFLFVSCHIEWLKPKFFSILSHSLACVLLLLLLFLRFSAVCIDNNWFAVEMCVCAFASPLKLK